MGCVSCYVLQLNMTDVTTRLPAVKTCVLVGRSSPLRPQGRRYVPEPGSTKRIIPEPCSTKRCVPEAGSKANSGWPLWKHEEAVADNAAAGIQSKTILPVSSIESAERQRLNPQIATAVSQPEVLCTSNKVPLTAVQSSFSACIGSSSSNDNRGYDTSAKCGTVGQEQPAVSSATTLRPEPAPTGLWADHRSNGADVTAAAIKTSNDDSSTGRTGGLARVEDDPNYFRT